MTNTAKIKQLLAEIEALIDTKPDSDIRLSRCFDLVVKERDEPEQITWREAMGKFGPDGTDKDWRLPTRTELMVMFEQKQKLPNIESDRCYWSSSEYYNTNAWIQRFSDGYQTDFSKNLNYLVRCVRR